MIKVCGFLKEAKIVERFGEQVVSLVIEDRDGGDYAPKHYVDDDSCRNWKDVQGQYVEIPCSMNPSASKAGKVYSNIRVLSSVDPKKCTVSAVKAA